MKKVKDIYSVSQEQLSFLLNYLSPRKFNVTEELVYEGHVPFAGYVLLEGKITIEKRKKVIATVPINGLVGVSELLDHLPLPFTLKIHANSQALILDKSSVSEMMELDRNLFLKANA